MMAFPWRKPLIGMVDFPEPGRRFRSWIRVEGWALARNKGAVLVDVLVDGHLVPARLERQPRPDVLAAYAWARRGDQEPGFTAVFSAEGLSPGAHEVAVWVEDGANRVLLGRRTIRLVSQEDVPSPLLFVHIPKTAGTSLNAYLEKQYPADTVCLHAENRVFSQPEEEIRTLSRYDLLTAHLEVETLERVIDTARFTKLTVFRRPERQLISHLAWIRKLGAPERAAELASHPAYIRAAVERLERLGTSAFLDDLTEEESRLLDNCQVRYLLPQATRDVSENQLNEALGRLEEIDLVGITEQLDDFLLLLACSMGWEPSEKAPRLNTGSREHLRRFESAGEDVARQIERLTRLDRVVYAAAQAKFSRLFREMLHTLGLPEDSDPDRTRLRERLAQRARAK